MHSFMAVAVVARLILLTVHLKSTIARGTIAAAAPGAETNNLGQADATFLHTDEDELLAAIVGARISEPDRVAGVLSELRVESTGHLARLDLELGEYRESKGPFIVSTIVKFCMVLS